MYDTDCGTCVSSLSRERERKKNNNGMKWKNRIYKSIRHINVNKCQHIFDFFQSHDDFIFQGICAYIGLRFMKIPSFKFPCDVSLCVTFSFHFSFLHRSVRIWRNTFSSNGFPFQSKYFRCILITIAYTKILHISIGIRRCYMPRFAGNCLHWIQYL